MKVWREAASLILTANKPRTVPTRVPTTSQNAPPGEVRGSLDWSKVFDYQVLMLKRSSRSKFMPNAFVFPGGVSSDIDFSKEWKEYFGAHGVDTSDLHNLLPEGQDRPFLLEAQKTDPLEQLDRHISFRLSAIRETFEESGILLYYDRKNKEKGLTSAHTFNCDSKDLEIIRKKVHSEPSEILKLYKDLQLLPDIFNLSEWSDWLTPVDLHEQGARRFDTMFYTACLPELPQTILEKQEISAVSWAEPASILNQFYQQELWLAPPQVYELCRLLNFENLQQLNDFARKRQNEGCVNWLPVRLKCEDGLLSLLPGDSMYPENPDFTGSPDKKNLNVYKGTIEDSMLNSKNLNRLTFKDRYDCIPKVNIPASHGHVNPLEYQTFQMDKL